MRIRVLSDLHLEFQMDAGESFLSGQRDTAWDVLVLAGDITNAPSIERVGGWIRKAAGSRPVVWVAGNHEYYGGSVESARRALEAVRQEHRIHALEDEVVEIDGQRFVGATLWFRHGGVRQAGDDLLGDFRAIRGFREWVGVKALESAEFLAEEVRAGDVVVTHHLPHIRSVAARFVGDPLTRYFLHDLSDFVEVCGARLWVHGHTHDSMDYRVGQTRVLCNPFGYRRYEENAGFRDFLTVQTL